MKTKIRTLLVFGFFLTFAALAQSRAVTFNASDVSVDTVTLSPLVDGGCVLAVCGRIVDGDGEAHVECLPGADIKASVNQGRCTALVDRAAMRLANRFKVGDGGTP